MNVDVVVPVRRLLLTGLVAGVLLVLWWAVIPAAAQEEPGPEPLATFAFLARADNPVDALAAGALAGALGGPVLLTGTDVLDPEAAAGLSAAGPQVVVLAGGTAALSDQVEAEVAALLPAAEIRRVGGAGRTATARLLSSLPAELGIGRPLLTDTTISGDVVLAGDLTVDGQDVIATLTALIERVTALEDATTDLRSDLATAEERVAALEATLAGVQRTDDLLTFEGLNVQVTNGAGGTAATNGLGNLIVGYDEDHTTTDCVPANEDCAYAGDGEIDTRTGSHMLVIGPDHSYTGAGGIIAGVDSTTANTFASVTGGYGNSALGFAASITGGRESSATHSYASVTGGLRNTASGLMATVTGGRDNEASGSVASVTGGWGNAAVGEETSIVGGSNNTASGLAAAILAGDHNTASGRNTSVAGGQLNTAGASWSMVAGGSNGTISTNGVYDSLIGGTQSGSSGLFTDG